MVSNVISYIIKNFEHLSTVTSGQTSIEIIDSIMQMSDLVQANNSDAKTITPMSLGLLEQKLTTMWPTILSSPGFANASPSSKVMNILAMSKKNTLIMNDVNSSSTTTPNGSTHSSNSSVSRKDMLDFFDSSESRNPLVHKTIIIKKKMDDIHGTRVETTATVIDEEKSGHLAVISHYLGKGERHTAYNYLVSLGSPIIHQQLQSNTVISHPMAIALNQLRSSFDMFLAFRLSRDELNSGNVDLRRLAGFIPPSCCESIKNGSWDKINLITILNAKERAANEQATLFDDSMDPYDPSILEKTIRIVSAIISTAGFNEKARSSYLSKANKIRGFFSLTAGLNRSVLSNQSEIFKLLLVSATEKFALIKALPATAEMPPIVEEDDPADRLLNRIQKAQQIFATIADISPAMAKQMDDASALGSPTIQSNTVVAPQGGNNKRTGANLVAPTLPNKKGKGKAKTNPTNDGKSQPAIAPGDWKNTVKINKSDISIELPANSRKPARTLKTTFSALTSLKKLKAKDRCWAYCIMSMFPKESPRATEDRRNSYGLRFCTCHNDAAHAQRGKDMHDVPTELTSTAAQNF